MGEERGKGKEKGVSENVITVSLGDRSYDIFFGTGMGALFKEWVARFYREGRVFVVTDGNVHSIYGGEIGKWLSGISFDLLALPPGEDRKRWDTVQEIYTFLARGGAGRESLLVAFGGGVVGDLAGFAAATYLRGIPFVQVPTTLLSQVDSSVGGKTGFNLAEGKNLVGAFHQPRAVFIDPSFLLTLDRRNLRAGLAEVVKCAFAGAPSLLDSIAARAGTWEEMSGDAWITIIRSAVAFKASVVEQDEKESSTRRILNLGHTIGHALEQASGYRRLLHGEAVAMGLAWEAVFSRRQGVTPPGLERRMIDLLLALGFRLDDPEVPLSAIVAAIGMDKKRVVSDIDMPLLTGPGSCALRRIPVSILGEALPAVREEIRAILRDRTGEAKLKEGAFELRPADRPLEERAEAGEIATGPPAEKTISPPDSSSMVTAAPIRTVTMASVYWDQGRQEEARRIIEGILRENPEDPRALAWLSESEGKPKGERVREKRKPREDKAVSSLTAFLEKMAREYGYDVSRHH